MAHNDDETRRGRARGRGAYVAPPPPPSSTVGVVRYLPLPDTGEWWCKTCCADYVPYRSPDDPGAVCASCKAVLALAERQQLVAERRLVLDQRVFAKEEHTVAMNQLSDEMARTRKAEEEKGGSAGRVAARLGASTGKTASRPTDPTSPWYDFDEVGVLLRCGRTKIFEYIKEGDLVPVPDAPGRRTLVTRTSVLALQEKLLPTPKAKRVVRRPKVPAVTSEKAPEPPTEAELLEQRRRLFK